MSRTYTAAQLAEAVGGSLRGDGAAIIRGVGDVSEAGPDQATWVSRGKYVDRIAASRAGVVLVPEDFGQTPMPAVLCPNIERSVAALFAAFAPPISRPAPGVHATAVIHPRARIGAHASLGPHVVIDEGVVVGKQCIIHAGVFIGRDTTVGDDCEFWPNVVIRDGCRIGSRVSIHSCSVIGADGFGYYFDQGRHNKIPHIGGVVIEDDVEIGAGTCVDRSKFGATIIGAGTKIDNQVQVAHNCRIGRHSVLAGKTGAAGSARIGDFCVLGACAVVLDNVAVGNSVTLAAMAVADKDLPAGLVVSGNPAQEHRDELRERAHLRRLPKLIEQLKDLTARVESLETSAHHRP